MFLECGQWLLRYSILFAAWAASAQVRPSFEVASAKPVQTGRAGAALHGGPGTDSPGQLRGTATLRMLLMRAYDLKEYQVSGPAWIDAERYEIAARIPAGADKRAMSLMLQSLLADRFRLAAHRETRRVPVYWMLVAKTGPKLEASPSGDANSAGKAEDAPLPPIAVPKLVKGAGGLPDLLPGSDVPRSYSVVVSGSDGLLYKLWARRETMAQLADRLSAHLDRAVIDRTGLRGQYDFTLAWSVESAGGIVPRRGSPPDQIESLRTPVLPEFDLPIFTAIQTQLGLRLEPRKGPLDVLVVDRAERVPSEN